ncbi:MAG: pantoate--beta-alanine ligase, partial [Planctomycetes bacterium]|nr:pantoate--beta-alanine ligase [Planctomycetota bacterium]
MNPAIFETCATMSAFAADARAAGRSIGFVPTMGALHEGHFSLIRRARAENDLVVVSIFVNPAQFGPGEDLGKYPRTFEQDAANCGRLSVDAIFAPDAGEMYADHSDTFVVQEKLTSMMCGASRPGHFRGVLTVCCKLFNIVAPHTAYFGRKDYQQAVLVGRMVADLCMPLRIEVCPTIREADGLAISSRNKYLSAPERADALCLSRALALAEQMAADGEIGAGNVIDAMKDLIAGVKSATIDYVVIADPETLEPLGVIEGPALAALAVKIGGTRLIDNATIQR